MKLFVFSVNETNTSNTLYLESRKATVFMELNKLFIFKFEFHIRRAYKTSYVRYSGVTMYTPLFRYFKNTIV
jgi:hypothetical protein